MSPLKKPIIKKNKNVRLKRAKDYYENDQERLRKQTRNKCRNLSEEEKMRKFIWRRKKWEERIWKKHISSDIL